MFDHLSDSARDWRASKTFVEIVRMSVDKVHALESIAAKLDEMLPHYAPPVAPEPVKMVNYYFDTLLPPVDMGGPSMTTSPARWSDDGRLYEAARAIYGAGCWSASNLTLVEQDKLWAALRDALGLKAGAPNKPAIVVTNTPRLSDFNGR